ncbi:MAG: flagellar hook-basal body protein [candidate division NC10 bacterium]|nr:flagellar hook-basal body protein [candidate division NC10 bacterium]
MISGLYVAASGMMAQMAKMEVLSQNLANAGTPGFKGDLLVIEGGRRGPLQPAVLVEGSPLTPQPVRAGRRVTDFSRGLIRQTENPLDLANNGSGFFVVQTPRGVRYTRAGNFAVGADGALQALDGSRVQGKKGEIRVPSGRFVVDSNGRILVNGQEIDRLRMIDPDPAALIREGGSLFTLKPSAEAPPPAKGVEIRQGYLEGSNVDPVVAMTQLMVSLRASEAYQKALHALAQSLNQAASELSRI